MSNRTYAPRSGGRTTEQRTTGTRSGSRTAEQRTGAPRRRYPTQGTAALAPEAVPAGPPDTGIGAAPRLRVAPPAPVSTLRAPFVAVVIAMVVAGVFGILLINTKTNENTFEISRLQDRQAALDNQEQRLENQIAGYESTGNLDAAARRLGLVKADTPAYIRLPDGKIIGVPRAGVGQRAVTASDPSAVAAAASSANATQANATQADGTQADGTQADGTQADGTQAGSAQAGGSQAGGSQANATQAGGSQVDATPDGGTAAAGGTQAGGTAPMGGTASTGSTTSAGGMAPTGGTAPTAPFQNAG